MQIIKIKNKYGNIIECYLKELDISYLDKIDKLQNEIVEGLEDKEWFATTEKEQYESYLRDKETIILGVVNKNNDELIAMSVYVKFGYDEENYGYDLDISGEELLSVAQIESSMVRKEYRGNGLQVLLCSELEKVARNDHMKILSATVCPNNKYSLNSVTKLGYKAVKEKLKYGGYRRYILMKKLV